jgi:NAD/NADP transhydrogenase alpha subunit
MSITIGVPRETFAGEKRVATVPEVVEKLQELAEKRGCTQTEALESVVLTAPSRA